MYNNNITEVAVVAIHEYSKNDDDRGPRPYIIYILYCCSNTLQNFAGTACVSCNTLFQSLVIKNALFEGEKN